MIFGLRVQILAIYFVSAVFPQFLPFGTESGNCHGDRSSSCISTMIFAWFLLRICAQNVPRVPHLHGLCLAGILFKGEGQLAKPLSMWSIDSIFLSEIDLNFIEFQIRRTCSIHLSLLETWYPRSDGT